jgi:N-acetylglucosamine-6-phosphate deacetylase
VPAFIDIQLYGGNGLLFADHPSVESIKATYDYSLQGGASSILPTIGTHTFEKIIEAVRAVKEYWQQGLHGVEGLHVEGPIHQSN